jgi:tripartite-type tricarboxylate transporter receptor subunit TctC
VQNIFRSALAANGMPNHRPRRMTGWWLALLAALTMAGSMPASHAGGYPERTIKIVVPFPAGGPTDVAARLIAQSISTKLGQGVVVENHAGAGGRIGAKVVASATPDGYTLLLGGTNVNAMAGAIYKDLGFDPIGSFAPIASICTDSMGLAVSPNVPASTFAELVKYARDNPGKLKYGAPPGIYTQFAAEYFKAKTGTDILFVPYKGGAPALTDVLGGHIEMTFNNKSTVLPSFKDGRLKAFAVTSAARWPELPQTPTLNEVGVTGFPTEVLFGLLAPAGTPAAIIQTLNEAINDGLRSPEVRRNLEALGVEAKIGTPQELATALAEQAREWKTVIDVAGIAIE